MMHFMLTATQNCPDKRGAYDLIKEQNKFETSKLARVVKVTKISSCIFFEGCQFLQLIISRVLDGFWTIFTPVRFSF
jgi:hypothetical protein